MTKNSRSRFGQNRMKQARARQPSSREPYNKILIVCEGKKTEPNYFNGLRNFYELSTKQVDITGNGGSSPSSVVKYAYKLYQKSQNMDNQFDRVFCVFDKNDHADYNEALVEIKSRKLSGVFKAINSVPAFEYFLILHYEYTTSELTSVEALARLKNHMPGYQKGDKNIFSVVGGRLETAKRNAVRSWADAIQSKSAGPITKVHKLVKCMANIKRLQ